MTISTFARSDMSASGSPSTITMSGSALISDWRRTPLVSLASSSSPRRGRVCLEHQVTVLKRANIPQAHEVVVAASTHAILKLLTTGGPRAIHPTIIVVLVTKPSLEPTAQNNSGLAGPLRMKHVMRSPRGRAARCRSELRHKGAQADACVLLEVHLHYA